MINITNIAENTLAGILQVVLNFVLFICNLILMPIDAIISSIIPDFTNLTSYINDALGVCTQYLGYILDSFGFYSATIVLFIGYLTIKLTIPLQVWLVKLAVRWYDNLKF